jgi:hypothetical protein
MGICIRLRITNCQSPIANRGGFSLGRCLRLARNCHTFPARCRFQRCDQSGPYFESVGFAGQANNDQIDVGLGGDQEQGIGVEAASWTLRSGRAKSGQVWVRSLPTSRFEKPPENTGDYQSYVRSSGISVRNRPEWTGFFSSRTLI